VTRTRDEDNRAAFREGAQAMLGPALGVAAWGLVTGVAMAQSPLSPAQAIGFMLLAFAGSAQLAALPLIVAGAPVWVTTLTALVVNLRFVIYSLALARPLGHLRFRRRVWVSYLIGDVPFALFSRRLAADPEWSGRVAYFTGIILTNWACWQTSQITGYLLGARIPRAWGLELAGTLALVALLVPMVRGRVPALVGVAVTAVVAIATYRVPLRLGVLLSMLVGVTAALAVDWLASRVRRPTGLAGGS
jgi:predicted branched-subunit amino acid permease